MWELLLCGSLNSSQVSSFKASLSKPASPSVKGPACVAPSRSFGICALCDGILLWHGDNAVQGKLALCWECHGRKARPSLSIRHHSREGQLQKAGWYHSTLAWPGPVSRHWDAARLGETSTWSYKLARLFCYRHIACLLRLARRPVAHAAHSSHLLASGSIVSPDEHMLRAVAERLALQISWFGNRRPALSSFRAI